MPIRKIAGQVTVTRNGKRAVVPPMKPFNFTQEEIDYVNRLDSNIVRKVEDHEMAGALKFEDLPDQRTLSRSAVPVDTSAEETAPSQPGVSQPATDEASYEDMTVSQLKELAKSRDIEVPSGANKSEIIELISGDRDDL